MELKELKSFVAVVKYKSFTRAANELYLAQPTISMHIKLLEDELNVRLLQRGTKKIVVTEKGKEFYEYATKMIGLENTLMKKLNVVTNNLIRIGVSSVPSLYFLPEIVEQYKKNKKDIEFIIKQSDSEEIIDAVKNGSIDIGLIGIDYNNNDLVCEAFAKDKMVYITSNKVNPKTKLKELLKMPYIEREEGSGSRVLANEILESYGIDENDLKVVAYIQNQDTIIKLVKAGIGGAIVSSKAIESDVKDGSVLSFELPTKKNKRNLNIIYDVISKKNNVIKDFIEYVKKFYYNEDNK